MDLAPKGLTSKTWLVFFMKDGQEFWEHPSNLSSIFNKLRYALSQDVLAFQRKSFPVLCRPRKKPLSFVLWTVSWHLLLWKAFDQFRLNQTRFGYTPYESFSKWCWSFVCTPYERFPKWCWSGILQLHLKEKVDQLFQQCTRKVWENLLRYQDIAPSSG